MSEPEPRLAPPRHPVPNAPDNAPPGYSLAHCGACGETRRYLTTPGKTGRERSTQWLERHLAGRCPTLNKEGQQ